MRFGNAILCLLSTALICPALLATDRWYGTVQGWGLLIDPDGDCSFTIAADEIAIGVPATPHGLSAELNKMNAPRVLQQAGGDFELQVEVAGTFQPQQPTIATRTPYLGAGLVLMHDDENYIRLERAALRRGGRISHYVNFEQRRDGRLLRFGTPTDFSLQADDEVQLKLSIRGKSVEGFARKNNEDWQTLGEKQFLETGGLSAGIAAINATSVPQKAVFRSFQLTRQASVVAELDQKLPNSTPKSAFMKRLLAERAGPAGSPEDDAEPESAPAQPLPQEKNESASEFESPFQQQALGSPFPETTQNGSRNGGEVRNLDLPALEGRARPKERVRKTGQERRQTIDKWSREGAAKAIKEFQARLPTEQFPEERFPLFSSPEMQKLLWDEDADDKLRLLRKQRCRIALMECSARMSEYRGGRAHIAPVLDSSRRLASSLLALEPDSSTRLIILRHDLAVAQDLEKYADVLLESGTGTTQDLAFAAYERIGAEIRLLQENERQQQQNSKVVP